MSVLRIVVLAALALALAAPASAQRRQSAEEREYSQFNVPYDGRFAFVRLRFEPLPGFGGGGGFFRGRDLKWDHDYPRAERHLATILSELTVLEPYMGGSNILAVDDPELTKYPIAYMAEPGFWTLTEREATALRNYLLKGGFLIFDDFAGNQWFNFEQQLRRVLPDARLVPLEVSHPIFHSFFDIQSIDHVHPYYGMPSQYLGVFEDNDPEKRLLAIVNYNNDIGEYWEWSDTGFLPIDLSNEAYKLGVNYVVYAMTH